MAKFTDDEVAEKLIEFEKFKDRAEKVLDNIEKNNSEQKKSSVPIKEWSMIISAVVLILGALWQAFKPADAPSIDYQKLAETIKGLGM